MMDGCIYRGVECSLTQYTLTDDDGNIGQPIDYEDDICGLLRGLNNTFKHRGKGHQRLAVYVIMNELGCYLTFREHYTRGLSKSLVCESWLVKP